jgi:uncharacterized protein with PIN domain
MRFIADRMLGKLARLLRIIGYDAQYVRNAEQDEVKGWLEKGIIFLTRGTRYQNFNSEKLYCVQENYPIHQLVEVIKKFNLELREDKFFSRCLECNKELIPAPEEDVKRRVPEFVKLTKSEFFMCPECRRIYWEGSHRTHMQEIIDTVKKELLRRNEK